MTGTKSDTLEALLRTTEHEAVKEASKLSNAQLDAKVDETLSLVLSGTVTGDRLVTLRHKAAVLARTRLRRGGASHR